MFNQFSGINIVFYFAPRLLGLAGLDDTLKASIALGLTNLVFTFIGLRLIDRIGRRALLYAGSIGYIVSLGVCSWVFISSPYLKIASAANDLANAAGTLAKVEGGERYMSPRDRAKFEQGYAASKDALVAISKAEWFKGTEVVIPEEADAARVALIAGRCKAEVSKMLGSTGIVVLVALMAFIAAHAVGQGAVIWVFISEIFPNDHRAAGQALGSSTHWICAAGLTTVFPLSSAASNPVCCSGFSAS